MSNETSGGSRFPHQGWEPGNHPRKAPRQHFRTAWKARTYGDRVVAGVQLRSHGQSTWLQADELRHLARELDRLADDHDSASTAEIPQSRPNRKKVQP